MALRATGTLYVWIPVALILWLVQREHEAALAKRHALLVIGSPALAGLLCEVMKLLIRRERPDVGSGEWVFRAWSDHTFSTAGLATPSSHTMVAFGAATMLARMYPRACWVFYVLAWGCGATRVLSHAHYLSDVTFGALLGWAVGWGVWIQWGRTAMEDVRSKMEDGDPKTDDRGPKTEDGVERRVMKRREFIAAGAAAAGARGMRVGLPREAECRATGTVTGRSCGGNAQSSACSRTSG